MTLFEKLMKVQCELKVPKNQYNSFGKYKYRSTEDILEALKPILASVKAVVAVEDEIIQIEDRFYIKATATFIDAETSEKFSTSALAREELTKKGMDASQITGSTSSYARKYALNGLFLIDDEKDSDYTNNSVKQGQLNELQQAQQALFSIVSIKGISSEQMATFIKERYKKLKSSDLTVNELVDLKKFIAAL